jgi:hypothetical protein
MNLVKELPENAVQIKSVFDLVDVKPEYKDFHKPRYGGTLFIKQTISDYYEYYPFNEEITSEKIIKYIESNQLFFAINFVPL